MVDSFYFQPFTGNIPEKKSGAPSALMDCCSPPLQLAAIPSFNHSHHRTHHHEDMLAPYVLEEDGWIGAGSA
jgi:hypothetical protein